MSIIIPKQEKDGKFKGAEYLKVDIKKDVLSAYAPSDEEKKSIALIRDCFYKGYVTMYTPRIEFNDLSTYHRYIYDQFLWNTYQPNNGKPASEDKINGWRSNAMRPIVRNKSVSIAAHASAKMLFPKVFAYNEQSEMHEDSAKVMSYLMEWFGQRGGYAFTSLHAIIASLSTPASIVFSEYSELTRKVKDERQPDGSWSFTEIDDPQFSGPQFANVPVDELFIANIFEADIQKQDWLIWRKVVTYDTASIKYGHCDNWKHIMAGMQTLVSDANQGYYNKYDNHMRGDEVEEITLWHRAKDLKISMVNGVMVTKPDEANPRIDKLFPFAKFGYSIINPRFFYYKSLSASLQQDATIITTLYRMIIDGTYLAIMPPMVNTGSEKIGSNVIVPGLTTNLSDKDATLSSISTAKESTLNAGLKVLDTVTASANESSQDPVQAGQSPQDASTAYQISRVEQNAATVLGLFIKMIVNYVQQQGRLMKGDILQYLTVADAAKITGDGPLTYKTFIVNGGGGPSDKNKRIVFDGSMPDAMTEEQQLMESIAILQKQGGMKSNVRLYKVNPKIFREMDFHEYVDADTLSPRSQELERAFNLETFDRAINSPVADQELIFTDLLMASNPKTARDPSKYVKKAEPAPQQSDPNAEQTMRTPAKPTSGVDKLPQGAMSNMA